MRAVATEQPACSVLPELSRQDKEIIDEPSTSDDNREGRGGTATGVQFPEPS